MTQIVAFSCSLFMFTMMLSLIMLIADTELTPRSTSPSTMFVSFVQIMAEKLGLGQNLVGRLSNKRKFLVSGKNLLCL